MFFYILHENAVAYTFLEEDPSQIYSTNFIVHPCHINDISSCTNKCIPITCLLARAIITMTTEYMYASEELGFRLKNNNKGNFL